MASLGTLGYSYTHKRLLIKYRLLTVAQALVFGVSTVARVAQHLAITTLEITTFAFIFADIATSCFWRHKPQDIKRPITLRSKICINEILMKV